MSKDAKAPCPVCGNEVYDPDFSKNRARRVVLKCAHCQTKLEWAKPLSEKWHMHQAVIIAIITWGWLLKGGPANPTLHRYMSDASLGFLALSLLQTSLEKTGILPLKLKVTNRPYEDPTPFTTKLKEERAQSAPPRLQVNPHSAPPPFLAGQSVLAAQDPTPLAPESSTTRVRKWFGR